MSRPMADGDEVGGLTPATLRAPRDPGPPPLRPYSLGAESMHKNMHQCVHICACFGVTQNMHNFLSMLADRCISAESPAINPAGAHPPPARVPRNQVGRLIEGHGAA